MYFSIILKPRKNPSDLSPITQFAAEAVAGALKEHDPQIKPPNDILIDGKKVCGILTEKVGESLIVGIGLNVNIKNFPEGLQATSIIGDREEIFQNILSRLKEEYLKYLGVGI